MVVKSGRTDITLHADGVALEGELVIPTAAVGVVVFAHASGNGRFAPRHRVIAEILHGEHIGTLLFDLLTEHEAEDPKKVLDVELLTGRLLVALDWLRSHPETDGLTVGLFGAGTGASAAIVAAADRRQEISVLVSRGGRLDLVEARLREVRSPTLLLVGEADRDAVRLNRRAYAELHCQKHLVLVPGATQQFEEPGALEEAAHHATSWFRTHLRAAPVAV
jgi:putative phosphoribosyl transferase